MKQPVDSFFNKKLNNYNTEAPASAWGRIDANLAKQKKPFVWLKIAASLLFIALAGYAIYTTFDTDVEQIAEIEIPASAEKEIRNDAKSITPEPEKVASTPLQEPIPQPIRTASSNPKKKIPENMIEKETFTEPVELTVAPTVTLAENTIQFEVNPIVDEPETMSTTLETTTILISAEEANAKYLNQQFIADATLESKKSSKIRNLFEKAQDLDPIGEIRQLKNEVLALNFRNEKKGERNR